MTAIIRLGKVAVDVLKKDIKNLHLSVYPPAGKVKISAPLRMNLATIRVFAISKLDWIKRQQRKLQEQERETSREYIDRESHYVWGKRHLLKVVERNAPPGVELRHAAMLLGVRPGTNGKKREAIVTEWYRKQIWTAVPPLIAKWEPLLGVRVDRLFVQRMKTKWGSCNPRSHGIRLNSELAKKPRECLEYIVVHELVHLLHPTHNQRFIELMDRLMPNWRFYRDILNQLPVRHEHWKFRGHHT